MQLDAMALFVLVAENGSFTATAKQTSQPKSTISQHISQLEQSLGIRLLHRTTRKVSLTDAGLVYLTHCRNMLDAAVAANAAISTLRQSPSGKLRITAPVATGELILPGLVSSFRARYPDIVIECIITDTNLDLIAERIDLALRVGKQADSSYVARHLSVLRRVMVASPDYIARCGQPKHPDDLVKHWLLRHDAMPSWALHYEQGTRYIHTSPSSLQSNNLNYLLTLAELGMGIAFLPWCMASPALENKRLICLLPEYPPTDNHYYLLYPSRKHKPAALTAMLDFINEYQLTSVLAPY